MKPELYACVYAAEFPSQAMLRLRPDLQSLHESLGAASWRIAGHDQA
jgi:hypothetical protein